MGRNCHKLVLAVSIAVLAFLSLWLFAAGISKPLSSDEQMYCTGGYLISKGLMPYRDFSYIAQLPYHPLLLGAVYKLTGTTHYLLAVRLVSITCDIFIVICLFSIFRKIFSEYFYSGILAGVCGCVLFVFNPFVGYLLGLAWNHDLTLLCIVLSLRIFISEKCSVIKIFAIASLLTIAVWTRPTSVFFVPVFFAMIIVKTGIGTDSFRHGLTRIYTVVLPFFSGVIVFSILPVYIILQSGRAFWLNIFTMPLLNSRLLHNLHIAYDKTYLTITAFRNNHFSLLIFTAVFICLCVFVFRKKIIITQKTNALPAIMLVIVSAAIAYFPPTMWKQYFGIPVIFIIIVMGFALRYLRELPPFIFTYKTCFAVFLTLSITTMISQNPISKISKSLSAANWTPIKIHNISKQIAAKAATSKPILTLSPLYAIEGGGQIYTELSAGAFAFRVADTLSENDRKLTKTAGVKNLPELTKSAGAVVIGAELTRFEKIALKNAIPANWVRIKFAGTDIFLPELKVKSEDLQSYRLPTIAYRLSPID
jgi:hypothetical protein